MAESSNSNIIVISPTSDVTIEVVEYDYRVRPNGQGERPVLNVAFLKVERKVLREKSAYFKKLLDPNSPFVESGKDTVQIKDDTVKSIELWFRCWHKRGSPDILKLPINVIWYALEAAQKYDLDLEPLRSWFSAWWKNRVKAFGIEDFRAILYPAQRLDNAVVFQYASKQLVYNSVGHITEINPTRHLHHHLRPLIIQQLNAAKGSLRSRLHRGLFEAIKNFLGATCKCKDAGLFAYCQGLDRTKVWPVEEYYSHKSIDELLEGLDQFRYDAPSTGCSLCKSDLGKTIVKKTQEMIEDYFDGLCLDCMDISQPKTGCTDNDYWQHDKLRKHDSSCRVRHGQPTWYFSFMGRREEMRAHNERQREMRALRHAE